jgi:hypothetical protein
VFEVHWCSLIFLSFMIFICCVAVQALSLMFMFFCQHFIICLLVPGFFPLQYQESLNSMAAQGSAAVGPVVDMAHPPPLPPPDKSVPPPPPEEADPQSDMYR